MCSFRVRSYAEYLSKYKDQIGFLKPRIEYLVTSVTSNAASSWLEPLVINCVSALAVSHSSLTCFPTQASMALDHRGQRNLAAIAKGEWPQDRPMPAAHARRLKELREAAAGSAHTPSLQSQAAEGGRDGPGPSGHTT